MTHKAGHFPTRFVVFDGPDRGKVVSIGWYDFAGEDVYEAIERHAETHARTRGAEIDIEVGTVMPSGKVGTYDRIGVRVRP